MLKPLAIQHGFPKSIRVAGVSSRVGLGYCGNSAAGEAFRAVNMGVFAMLWTLFAILLILWLLGFGFHRLLALNRSALNPWSSEGCRR